MPGNASQNPSHQHPSRPSEALQSAAGGVCSFDALQQSTYVTSYVGVRLRRAYTHTNTDKWRYCLWRTRHRSLPRQSTSACQLKDVLGRQGNILYLQNSNYAHCRSM
jgi:hypothetical protein